MKNKKMKAAGFLVITLAGLLITGCGGDSAGGTILSSLVSPNETYEKEDNSASSYELEDKVSLYEGDDISVVTMYLTVGQGNEDDGTNHTWTEVNTYPLSYYEENGIAAPYMCEAVLQVAMTMDRSRENSDMV